MGNSHSAVEEESVLTNTESENLKAFHSKLCGEGNVITIENCRAEFDTALLPHFGDMWYNVLVGKEGAEQTSSYNTVRSTVVTAYRTSQQTTLKFFFNLFKSDEDGSLELPVVVGRFFLLVLGSVVNANSNEIVHTANKCVNHYLKFNSMSTNAGDAAMAAPKSDPDAVIRGFCGWINEFFPNVPQVLMNYVGKKFLNAPIPKSSYQPVWLDKPSEVLVNNTTESSSSVPTTVFSRCTSSGGEEEGCGLMSLADVVPLSLHSTMLQGSWKLLYTSNVDGRSFNRASHAVLGYEGPTCILIQCSDKNKSVLGVFAEDRWKESNRFYGNSSNFLFTLSPELNIYRSKGGNDSFQYFDTKTYHRPHGLGMGGTFEKFRFFISESFDECVANTTCLTFEAGALLPNGDKTFDMNVLEIWGCGGDDTVGQALEAQAKSREIVAETIQKARQCDKAQFVNNAFDREFLLGNTFAHRSGTQHCEDEEDLLPSLHKPSKDKDAALLPNCDG